MKLVVSENEVARMRFWKENWSKPNLKESDCNYDWGQIPMLHFTVDWKQLCLVFYTTTTTPPLPPPFCFVHILATSSISSYQFILLSSLPRSAASAVKGSSPFSGTRVYFTSVARIYWGMMLENQSSLRIMLLCFVVALKILLMSFRQWFNDDVGCLAHSTDVTLLDCINVSSLLSLYFYLFPSLCKLFWY